MAEYGAGPAGKQRSSLSRQRHRSRVANQVDTAVHPVKASGIEAMRDRTATETRRPQLRQRYDPALPGRDRRNRAVGMGVVVICMVDMHIATRASWWLVRQRL